MIFKHFLGQRKIHVLLFSLLIVLSSVIQCSYTFAQDQIQSLEPDKWSRTFYNQSAMVTVDGRPLFRVIGVSSFPAKKRAKMISERIIELAKDNSFDPSTLKVREYDNGVLKIFAGEKPLMVVVDGDVLLEGEAKPLVFATEFYLPQIVTAIENYRHERRAGYLKKMAAYAFLRTAALILMLVLLFWSFKKTDQFLEQRFKLKIETLESKSKRILKAQHIWTLLTFIVRISRVIVVLFTLYFFINFVLSLFPWTRYIAQTLMDYITDPLSVIIQGIVDYIPNLFFLIILYLIIRYLLKITRSFFIRVDLGVITLSGFDADWSWPTYRIIRVIVFILGVVIAYPYIPGSGSEAFRGISLLLGVLLSLGSTSLIANIIAGYTMTYRRAFKVGDRVKLGDHVGDVTEIRVLETHLKSLKNEEIIIPNSLILTGEVTNYSALANKEGVILHTTIGIGYDVPWRQVEAMLIMAARQTEGVEENPPPFVLQKSLGDFGISYELNAFCRHAKQMAQIYTNLHRAIQDVFNEYEVAIMTPHYMTDTADVKIVPKEKWHSPPAPPPR